MPKFDYKIWTWCPKCSNRQDFIYNVLIEEWCCERCGTVNEQLKKAEEVRHKEALDKLIKEIKMWRIQSSTDADLFAIGSSFTKNTELVDEAIKVINDEITESQSHSVE